MATNKADWADALHQRIADAIKAARQDKFTAEKLEGETERLGHPVSRYALANYESGRKRRLDVAELVVLATALDVAPSELLFPGDPDDLVELPGQTMTTLQARAWFGANPLLDQLARAITGPPKPDKRVAFGGVVHKKEGKR